MAVSFKSGGGRGRTVADMLLHAATGLPAMDARDDFRRARRAHLAARLLHRFAGRRRRPGVPRTLADAAGLPRRPARQEVIALDAIVGTVEPTVTFDARFRPASEHVRARWERIALAHRRGIPLPPIAVLQLADGYYVADGRHRVSVARALGHRDIDARVTPVATLPTPATAPACRSRIAARPAIA
jgi:ParB-like nuclease domain